LLNAPVYAGSCRTRRTASFASDFDAQSGNLLVQRRPAHADALRSIQLKLVEPARAVTLDEVKEKAGAPATQARLPDVQGRPLQSI